jgi:hypothetical protein
LRETGTPGSRREALGVHRSTYTKRRGKCAVFATRWDAAVAAAHAAFHLAGGARAPEAAAAAGARSGGRRDGRGGAAAGSSPQAALRTRRREPTIVRRADGKLQLRLARAGRMIRAKKMKEKGRRKI